MLGNGLPSLEGLMPMDISLAQNFFIEWYETRRKMAANDNDTRYRIVLRPGVIVVKQLCAILKKGYNFVDVDRDFLK